MATPPGSHANGVVPTLAQQNAGPAHHSNQQHQPYTPHYGAGYGGPRHHGGGYRGGGGGGGGGYPQHNPRGGGGYDPRGYPPRGYDQGQGQGLGRGGYGGGGYGGGGYGGGGGGGGGYGGHQQQQHHQPHHYSPHPHQANPGMQYGGHHGDARYAQADPYAAQVPPPAVPMVVAGNGAKPTAQAPSEGQEGAKNTTAANIEKDVDKALFDFAALKVGNGATVPGHGELDMGIFAR